MIAELDKIRVLTSTALTSSTLQQAFSAQSFPSQKRRLKSESSQLANTVTVTDENSSQKLTR